MSKDFSTFPGSSSAGEAETMKVMTYGILVGVMTHFSATVVWAQPEKALPPAANGILERMEKEIKVSRTKALRDLDKVLKDTTKSGDLAGAVAIKEVMDQLKTEIETSSGGPAMAAFAGDWRTPYGVVTLQTNGAAIIANNPSVTGRWTLDGKNLRLQWTTGVSYDLNVTAAGLSGVRIDPQGNRTSSSWTRLPAGR